MTAAKTAIVSHILPPSPSGQAMVLFRLLEGMPADRYCLISREDGAGAGAVAASERLPGRCHRLKPSFQLSAPGRLNLPSLVLPLNAALGIHDRAKQIAAIAARERCGLIVGCTGDLFDLPAACLAARRAGIPFVPYLFDDYVHQWTGPSRSLARRLEPALFRRSRGAIVPNEFLQAEYARRYGASPALIRNPCPMPDLDALDRAGPADGDGGTRLVYTGAVYRAHYDAFRNLAAALRILGRPDMKLHVFTAQTEAELAQAGIRGPGIVLHPHIPQSEVPQVLRRADILFLPLAFRSPIPEVVRTSAPGKTGEYLASGRAILVHAPADSFLSWYFRANGCGAIADRDDPADLAAAIRGLAADGALRARLGAEGRKIAERDFDVDKIKVAFLKVLGAFEGVP